MFAQMSKTGCILVFLVLCALLMASSAPNDEAQIKTFLNVTQPSGCANIEIVKPTGDATKNFGEYVKAFNKVEESKGANGTKIVVNNGGVTVNGTGVSSDCATFRRNKLMLDGLFGALLEDASPLIQGLAVVGATTHDAANRMRSINELLPKFFGISTLEQNDVLLANAKHVPTKLVADMDAAERLVSLFKVLRKYICADVSEDPDKEVQEKWQLKADQFKKAYLNWIDENRVGVKLRDTKKMYQNAGGAAGFYNVSGQTEGCKKEYESAANRLLEKRVGEKNAQDKILELNLDDLVVCATGDDAKKYFPCNNNAVTPPKPLCGVDTVCPEATNSFVHVDECAAIIKGAPKYCLKKANSLAVEKECSIEVKNGKLVKEPFEPCLYGTERKCELANDNDLDSLSACKECTDAGLAVGKWCNLGGKLFYKKL